MKRCSICGIEKEVEEFHKRSVSRDGLDLRCKNCKKEEHRKYYKERGEIYRLRVAEHKRENIEKIKRYLQSHSCVDCGEADVVVLDFDHIRGKKFMDVSQMAAYYSWSRIKSEIEKCDVRCANCHRRITAKRRLSAADASGSVPVF